MADNFNISDSLRALRPGSVPGGVHLGRERGGEVDGASFKDVLGGKINEVNEMLLNKDRAIEDLATGKTDNVAEVLTAVEKADIAFKALMQIRNKLVDAYEEIQRMQI